MIQEPTSFVPQFAASSIARILWLIPAVPMFAAGIIALLKQPASQQSSRLLPRHWFARPFSFVIADRVWPCSQRVDARLCRSRDGSASPWFRFGGTTVDLGWVLDPLAAVMLVMVTFVGLLIFIYSVGYMAHDENFTRFFCFLSLFAGGMLGVVISNSILLLFMSWEIVGLTSYLLIGFWYHKPSGMRGGCEKAFVTTRVGDIFFFLRNCLAIFFDRYAAFL